jgi:hypothetical protein
LGVGNAIVTRTGPALIVQWIRWNRRAEGYTVYNFVVEDDHSYFVGTHNGGAWVHNPAGDCLAAARSLLSQNGGRGQIWKITPEFVPGMEEAPALYPSQVRPGFIHFVYEHEGMVYDEAHAAFQIPMHEYGNQIFPGQPIEWWPHP